MKMKFVVCTSYFNYTSVYTTVDKSIVLPFDFFDFISRFLLKSQITQPSQEFLIACPIGVKTCVSWTEETIPLCSWRWRYFDNCSSSSMGESTAERIWDPDTRRKTSLITPSVEPNSTWTFMWLHMRNHSWRMEWFCDLEHVERGLVWYYEPFDLVLGVEALFG